MRSPHRAVACLGGIAAALLLAYLVAWRTTDDLHVGRADFTSTYVGATLLREGQGQRLYDESLQSPLHARLIAPDTEGNLPFVNPPAAAAVALPLTTLDLDTAYRLWSLLQLLLLAAAVAIAVRAAPWPERTPRPLQVATGALALAGVGSLSLLLLGQWDGLPALGLAAAYASWRRGRMATGGAWLGVTAALAKPHLGLGLAALMIARRDRRLLAGAAAGVAAVAAACIVVAGPSGCAGFMRIAVGSAGRWNLASMLGFTGLFGSWLGDGGMTHAVAALATLVAVAACAALGSAWRHSPRQLEAALAGATALSLVASPHLLGHDLTLLSPAAAWCLGAATGVDGAAVRWPGRAARRVLALWALVNLAAAADLGNGHGAPPGRLVPIALVAIGAAAWTACRPRLRRARARRLGTSYAGRGSGVGGVVE